MKSRQGKLIIVSAPSGAGKTTLVHHLLKSGLGLEFSVSATSRPIRSGEIDGRDYHFISAAEFKLRAGRQEFLEWEEVYEGMFYGTLLKEVESRIADGRNVIFDIDVKGGLSIKKRFGNQALSIFIMPPSLSELENRLKARSSDPTESLRQRVEKAASELSFAGQFDHIIVNSELQTACLEIEELVRNFLEIPAKQKQS